MYEIQEIAAIVEQAGVANQGTDLFVYHAPAEVENCVILYPSNDPPRLDPQTPNYITGKFQTIVRNSTYQAGFELCKALSDALTFTNKDTGTLNIKQCRPLYQPRVYRRSDSGTLEFSITYQIHYVQK